MTIDCMVMMCDHCCWAPCSSVTNTALHPPTVQLLATNASLWSEWRLINSAWICVSWRCYFTAASDVCHDKVPDFDRLVKDRSSVSVVHLPFGLFDGCDAVWLIIVQLISTGLCICCRSLNERSLWLKTGIPMLKTAQTISLQHPTLDEH